MKRGEEDKINKICIHSDFDEQIFSGPNSDYPWTCNLKYKSPPAVRFDSSVFLTAATTWQIFFSTLLSYLVSYRTVVY